MLDPASRFSLKAKVEPSAQQLLGHLPANVGILLGEVLDLMDRYARENSISVTRTEVVARRDPEEATEKLVIRQWVNLPRDAAMEYWDRVGKEIEGWLYDQPDMLADQVAEWTVFTVYSEVDDAAA